MKLNPILIFLLFVHLLNAQVQDKVDFIHAEVFVEPILEDKMIQGSVAYEFKVLDDVNTIFLDAHDMDFSAVLLDDKDVLYENTKKKIVLKNSFKKGNTHLVKLSFKSIPKQTVYFIQGKNIESPTIPILSSIISAKEVDLEGNWTIIDQVWTQGQGKYTSHWLPSLDDMTDKIEFDINIIADIGFSVISNGELKSVDSIAEYSRQWKFDMQKPMSSYLVGFAIGDFDKKELKSSSGVPIELYYEPKDSLKVEPTYRYTQHIFDFLEKEIGVPYPWQNYKQVPVQDFLYAGMENTTCTIFSNQYVIDSTAFVDKNYVNVNAHELAHQWFGDLVTETSSEHHWLHEGFATFYAYLAEKDIFGEDYFYWHLLETANALENFSEDDQGEALRNSGAGSLTFYEKGAWALVMLQDKLGETPFKKGIQNYLNKYAYQNVTIPNFMAEMEAVSGMGLSDFESTWLHQSDFPFESVQTFLMEKNASIRQYFEIKSKIEDNPEAVESILSNAWDFFTSSQLKQNLILDYGKNLSTLFLEKVLKEDDLKVRQAVILSLDKVPEELQNPAEALLTDASYTTMESALYKLWSDFPEGRGRYLDKTQSVIGFPNKNIRLLWLTLALVTPEYRSDLKPSYLEELSNYTGAEYHFETRLMAFEYLKSIGGFNDESLKNLIEACSHHVWHFKKSARNILNEILKQEGGLARVKSIYPLLNQEEKQYLDKTLGE
ncbi:M1 family metallopeptidase [Flagellimonas pelagia]|uniref:Aminopeptidase N n=1 Tax=Flagellimonas pelagia TaxID=2306998 RepID=A0A3A1NEM1_9FLAO|nr:M1 family metallopeptidase [Allomuricauda maritima]RIV41907.1 M1 family peptidase [Allomuricauda maritima]TXJ90783.1 M1 family metallopeptidase [Allomuricauda maritima]